MYSDKFDLSIFDIGRGIQFRHNYGVKINSSF